MLPGAAYVPAAPKVSFSSSSSCLPPPDHRVEWRGGKPGHRAEWRHGSPPLHSAPGNSPANYHHHLITITSTTRSLHLQSHSNHQNLSLTELLPVPVRGLSPLLLLQPLLDSLPEEEQVVQHHMLDWREGTNLFTNCVYNIFLAAHLTSRLGMWLIELLKRILMVLLR